MSLLKNHEVRYGKTRYDHGSHSTDVFDFLTQEEHVWILHKRGASEDKTFLFDPDQAHALHRSYTVSRDS